MKKKKKKQEVNTTKISDAGPESRAASSGAGTSELKSRRLPDRQGWLGKNSNDEKVEALIRSNDVRDKPPQRLAVVQVNGKTVITINVDKFEATAETTSQAAALAWASTIAVKLAHGKIDREGAIAMKAAKLDQ
eukprot:8813483-Pyramimonas_sp.AAC.1